MRNWTEIAQSLKRPSSHDARRVSFSKDATHCQHASFVRHCCGGTYTYACRRLGKKVTHQFCTQCLS